MTQRNITLPYDLRIYESNMKERDILPYGMIIHSQLKSSMILQYLKAVWPMLSLYRRMSKSQKLAVIVFNP